MNIELLVIFLLGVSCGIVMGLMFAAMCFGVIAKIVIMAATYRHEKPGQSPNSKG